ncbi:MAG: glycosyltransferase [Verrucomicrobiae bacterium]|nr:glycosyltransferase [Verrucomicrobiae bacterium]
MRAVHVIASLDARDGGPTLTLPELWKHLGTAGVEVRALTTHAPGAPPPALREGVALRSFPRGFPSPIKRAPDLAAALREEGRAADVIHNHGCWLFPNWAAGRMARRLAKPLIISPLGHLDAWSLTRNPWRKRLIRALVEGRNWRSARAWVAKSEKEAAEIRARGLSGIVRVIPNGVDPARYAAPFDPGPICDLHPVLRERRVLLFLSRLHPKKGLPLLLTVWRSLVSRFPDWTLLIAGGADSEHARDVKEGARDLAAAGRVVFSGAVSGRMKDAAFGVAQLFVLPSVSENFGQAVLEALASGLPCIVSRACPWSEIATRDFGWWMLPEATALRRALEDALATPPTDLAAKGARGRAWALREFGWPGLARRMADLYREVST